MEEVKVENTEVVEEQTESSAQPDDVKLESDIANEEAEKPSYEDLQAELEELRKKNEGAEEIAKKLKDEKSQQKRQEAELTKKEQAELDKSNFMSETLESALENGLNDESFEKAEELGISKAELELAYYKSKESVNELYNKAGGKEEYFNMVDTVKEVATEQEVSMFKKALSNPEYADLALLALRQKYNEISGSESSNEQINKSRRLTPDVGGKTGNSGYKDMSEYQADMRKMRSLPTMKQSAYYAKIQDKLNRSNLA